MGSSKLSKREIEIGQRLKAYRLGKRISRAGFAGAIGIGTERLASYESGRAPLKYKVFRLIEKEFHLNPAWLALGGDYQPEANPMRDEELPDNISEQALFSEVFDAHLKQLGEDKSRIAWTEWQAIADDLEKMAMQARAGTVPRRITQRAVLAIRKLHGQMQAALRLSARVKSLLPQADAASSTARKKRPPK